MKRSILILAAALVFAGCDYVYDSPCKKVKYISAKALRANYPKVSAPREIEKAAKIYNYKDGDILLINERNKGIHIIDNRVRETPVNVGFIEIPGNIDMAVNSGYLYVDSFTDLIVLDIRDIHNVKTVYRKEDIFPYDPMQAVRDLQKEDGVCYEYDDSKRDAFVIGFK